MSKSVSLSWIPITEVMTASVTITSAAWIWQTGESTGEHSEILIEPPVTKPTESKNSEKTS